jgi:hypothetical protein
VESIKGSYQMMCCATNGGWSAMAESQGMSLTALQNRVYARKGQEITVSRAISHAEGQRHYFMRQLPMKAAVCSSSYRLSMPCPPRTSRSSSSRCWKKLESSPPSGAAPLPTTKSASARSASWETWPQTCASTVLHTTFKLFCKQDA